MRVINTTLLRLLLFTLGQGLALSSQISPSVGSQITRTLTFEVSTDDGVVRQWHFNGQRRRIATRQIPGTSPESVAFSKDLKLRGFSFVGPTVAYAYMQAAGLLNDHLVSCFRCQEILS